MLRVVPRDGAAAPTTRAPRISTRSSGRRCFFALRVSRPLASLALLLADCRAGGTGSGLAFCIGNLVVRGLGATRQEREDLLRRAGSRFTPIAAARLVRRARPLERRGGHLRMRRIRCRDCVPRTGREPRAMSWLSGLNPAVVCTLPWRTTRQRWRRAGVLSGRCSRPLRAEQRVKALAAEERIGGTAPPSADPRRGSRGRTVAGRHLRRPGTCLSGAGSRVDSWAGPRVRCCG